MGKRELEQRIADLEHTLTVLLDTLDTTPDDLPRAPQKTRLYTLNRTWRERKGLEPQNKLPLS